jgi:hypothetical protein
LALLPGSDHPIRWQLTVLTVLTGLVAPLRLDRAISSNHGSTASSLTRRRATSAFVPAVISEVDRRDRDAPAEAGVGRLGVRGRVTPNRSR